MIENVTALLAQRLTPQRATLINDCLFQFRERFLLENMDEVCAIITDQVDNRYGLEDVDIIVNDLILRLYKEKLLVFGVSLEPGYVNADKIRLLYQLSATLLDIDKHDDTDYLLAIAQDEDLNDKEVLGEWAHHIYGTDVLDVTCILDRIHSSLIPRATKALQAKLTKEVTVETTAALPDFIHRRLALFSGVYSGVFFDYVNAGGTIGVGFNTLIESVVGQLAALKVKPEAFINELILFTLSSDLPNARVVPTIESLITVNFPAPEEAVLAKAALTRYLNQHGATLNE